MSRITIETILSELKDKAIDFEFKGRHSLEIKVAKAISDFQEACISFYRGAVYDVISDIPAETGLLIIKPTIAAHIQKKGNYIITNNPDLAFCIAANLLKPKFEPFVHPTAIIAKDAIIANDVYIGANVVIGPEVQIKNRAIIEESACLKHCIINDKTHISPGVKIGSPGLGSHRDQSGKWHSFPHFGKVIIGQNVIIQDNCVLARGTLNDTIIDDGVEIGPLTWIAHGVQIKKNVLIGQAVTVAGSAIIQEGVIIWGRAAIRDGIIIGKQAIVGMGAVVVKDVPANVTVLGNPAKVKNT